jgi:hypothetical protein
MWGTWNFAIDNWRCQPFILCLRDSGIVSFIGGVEIHQAIYHNYNKHRRADTDKQTFIDYITT